MPKLIKWMAVITAVLILIIVAALIIIPNFIDIQKYQPLIEEQVSKYTGRPFTIGKDIDFSLFPWAGVSFSDLHLGSHPNFEEKDFISVKHFEVRIKLFPLIFKDIQVKRFILKGPRIVLEKDISGRSSWEGIGKAQRDVSTEFSQEPAPEPEKPSEEKSPAGLTLKGLAVGEFSITDGSVLWIDHAGKQRKEISDVTLYLRDVSLDRPVEIAFSALLDKQPLSLSGSIGPVGNNLNKGNIPLNLSLKIFKEVDIKLKGSVADPAVNPSFDLAVSAAPFSPKKLMNILDQALLPSAADSNVLNLAVFRANLKGNMQNVTVSDGILDIDDSRLKFSVNASDFSRPDIRFDLNLDKIDLDRYLPVSEKKKPAAKEDQTDKIANKEITAGQKKIDYAPLRRLVLKGALNIGKLKINNIRIQNFDLKITGKDGLFNLDPLTLNMYNGDILAKGYLDVRKNIPKSGLELETKKIQSGPFLNDMMEKDFLEGVLNAKLALKMTGDDAEKIKKTLSGKGDILFSDGYIKGLDLAGMIQNVKAAFDKQAEDEKEHQTEFAEFHIPFTIADGVVNTTESILTSPVIKVTAAGDANLVTEALDFRIEPQYIKDKKKRAKITVPVLLTGNFSSPVFRPDFKKILRQQIKERVLNSSKLKEKLKDEDVLKDVQDFIEKLPF